MGASPAGWLLLGALAIAGCHGGASGAAEATEIDSDPAPAPAVAEPEPAAPTIVPAREGWIDRASLDLVLDAGVGAFLGGLEVEAVHGDEGFVGWRVLRSDNPWVDVRTGDVLLSVNGAPIETPDQVQSLWESLRGAEAITASVERAGEPFEIRFEIGQAPRQAEAP